MTLPDNRYIWFRREWDASRGKWTKVPCNRDGVTINAHDPSQWVSHATAVAAATWTDGVPGPYGIAYVLDGSGTFCIDIDNCRTAEGWSAEAQAIWASFSGALGEVSTSGTGLHIFGRCDPALPETHRNKWGGNKEFYTTGRFVALSRNGPQPIGEWRDVDWTEQLRRIVPRRADMGELPTGRAPEYTGPEDDDALLQMMLRSSNGQNAFGGGVTFSDLWSANVGPLSARFPAYDGNGGFDHSSADQALMNLLAFWTGRDMPRMDRLFRRSALMRDKYAAREDYRTSTIHGAARVCKRVYDQPRRNAESDQPRKDRPEPQSAAAPTQSTAGAADRGEAYLTVPEMQQHFAGCVYVRDIHRVFVPDGALLKPEQFNAVYGGHHFQMMPDGSKPSKKAFEAFTESMAVRFPQARDVCFRPDLPSGLVLDDGRVNVYVAPNVDCRPGDVGPFLDLMARVLPDERDRRILLCYMAAMVQNPGVKFQWAPVLQGCEGNGKTAIFSALAAAVGKRLVHMPRANQLGGQFNGWVEGKVLIVVEEIHMEGRRDVLDTLKPLITNNEIETERKGVDQRIIDNIANWVFCTNYKDAVLKSRDDRRYAVFFTAQQAAGDLARDGMTGMYFPRLWDWFRDGGYAFVTHFLRTYEIDPALNPAGECHRAPRTSSTDEAISASTGGVEAEIIEAIEGGQPGFQGGWISTWHVLQLCEKARFRVARGTVAKILSGMGYREWGRAPAPIQSEDNKRPTLWRRVDMPEPVDFAHYLRSQGASYY